MIQCENLSSSLSAHHSRQLSNNMFNLETTHHSENQGGRSELGWEVGTSHLRKRVEKMGHTTQEGVPNYMSSLVVLLSTKLDKWLTIVTLLLSLTQRMAIRNQSIFVFFFYLCVLPFLSLFLFCIFWKKKPWIQQTLSTTFSISYI